MRYPPPLRIRGELRVIRAFLLLLILLSVDARTVEAECSEQAPDSAVAGLLVRHLSKDCSAMEREARSITAPDLLAALKLGHGVELSGVVITGDLLLDMLPLMTLDQLPTLTLQERSYLESLGLKEVRWIAGPLSIRDSIVKGRITTNLKAGSVVVKGPVNFTGTTFEQLLDLSQTVFLGPADFSHAVMLREGIFVQERFTRPTRFEQTAFGTHSRFHRSVFSDSVSFQQSGFNGLAEFLEIVCEKDANFSRTYFKQGTGFSGSRFRGVLDFSEALFDGEAYFLFTVFEGDAYFRRATFQSVADFSDAQFLGIDDFSKVFFKGEPRFSRAKVSGDPAKRLGLQNPNIQLGITISLLLFTALLLVYLVKAK